MDRHHSFSTPNQPASKQEKINKSRVGSFKNCNNMEVVDIVICQNKITFHFKGFNATQSVSILLQQTGHLVCTPSDCQSLYLRQQRTWSQPQARKSDLQSRRMKVLCNIGRCSCSCEQWLTSPISPRSINHQSSTIFVSSSCRILWRLELCLK